MNYQELASRLRDVSVTLAAMRKQKRFGYANPNIFHQIKTEKKLILKIQAEKGWLKDSQGTPGAPFHGQRDPGLSEKGKKPKNRRKRHHRGKHREENLR